MLYKSKSFKIVVLIGFVCVFGLTAQAQIQIKSEYIPYSSFKDENGNKLGGKGDLKTINGGIRIPISVKVDENNKPTAWAVALSGTYASTGTNLCTFEAGRAKRKIPEAVYVSGI